MSDLGTEILRSTERASPARESRNGRARTAPQREHGIAGGAELSPAEYAALIVRLDTNPTKADWAAYGRELDARIGALQQLRCI